MSRAGSTTPNFQIEKLLLKGPGLLPAMLSYQRWREGCRKRRRVIHTVCNGGFCYIPPLWPAPKCAPTQGARGYVPPKTKNTRFGSFSGKGNPNLAFFARSCGPHVLESKEREIWVPTCEQACHKIINFQAVQALKNAKRKQPTSGPCVSGRGPETTCWPLTLDPSALRPTTRDFEVWSMLLGPQRHGLHASMEGRALDPPSGSRTDA